MSSKFTSKPENALAIVSNRSIDKRYDVMKNHTNIGSRTSAWLRKKEPKISNVLDQVKKLHTKIDQMTDTSKRKRRHFNEEQRDIILSYANNSNYIGTKGIKWKIILTEIRKHTIFTNDDQGLPTTDELRNCYINNKRTNYTISTGSKHNLLYI